MVRRCRWTVPYLSLILDAGGSTLLQSILNTNSDFLIWGEHNRFLRQVGVHERLPPEVSNATEIGHSNVCKPFKIHTGSPRQGEIDFLTMEFLEGEPLPIDCATGRCPRTSDR